MERSEEILQARLFMAEALEDDIRNADPDAFTRRVNAAADGLMAASDSVEFHYIMENNGLTVED